MLSIGGSRKKQHKDARLRYAAKAAKSERAIQGRDVFLEDTYEGM